MGRCLLILVVTGLCGCGASAVPMQQKSVSDEPSSHDPIADDSAERQEFQNPLMRGVGELLDNSLGNEADVVDVLAEADSILSDIKDENADAIEAVNRQVHLDNSRPPNLLVIILDDVGYGELGCYGGPADLTPHIDALSSVGVRFSDFYAGAGLDAGSWWCMLTGQDTSRAVRGKTSSFALKPQAVTLAETLWQAGYSTAFVGRWGLGSDPLSMPHLHGFDEWFGLSEDLTQMSDPLQHLFSNGARVRLIAEDGRDPIRYLRQAVVSEAVSYLSRHSRKSEPFFLICSLSALPTGDQSRAVTLGQTDEDVGRIMAALGNGS